MTTIILHLWMVLSADWSAIIDQPRYDWVRLVEPVAVTAVVASPAARVEQEIEVIEYPRYAAPVMSCGPNGCRVVYPTQSRGIFRRRR